MERTADPLDVRLVVAEEGPEIAAGHLARDGAQAQDLGHHQEHHQPAISVDRGQPCRWRLRPIGCESVLIVVTHDRNDPLGEETAARRHAAVRDRVANWMRIGRCRSAVGARFGRRRELTARRISRIVNGTGRPPVGRSWPRDRGDRDTL